MMNAGKREAGLKRIELAKLLVDRLFEHLNELGVSIKAVKGRNHRDFVLLSSDTLLFHHPDCS